MFFAYAGAIFTQCGMGVVASWLGQLLDPENLPPNPDEATTHRNSADYGPVKRARMDSVPPPSVAPPPITSGVPPSGSPPAQHNQPAMNGTGSPSVVYLPMFNQRCAQQGLKVEYQAEFSGAPHDGRWSIICFGMCCSRFITLLLEFLSFSLLVGSKRNSKGHWAWEVQAKGQRRRRP